MVGGALTVAAAGLYATRLPGLALLEVGEALPPSHGDAILVLGGGMRDGVQLGFSTAERLALAAHLYAERQRDIVVSDGCMFAGVHGSIAMRSELIRMGVPPDRIVAEDQSQDTWANLAHSSSIARQRGYREVIVCTSPYHQRRVAMILRRLGLPDYRIARMPQSEVRAWWPLFQVLRTARLVARE